MIVKSLNGRIRILYSNNKKSTFAFNGRPAVKLNIDPVIGESSQLVLKDFPRIRSFIEDIILKEFDDFCLPN